MRIEARDLRVILAVVAIAMGGIALGAGVKVMLCWWGCLPNFIDGICWVVASAVCICWATRYCYSYYKRG